MESSDDEVSQERKLCNCCLQVNGYKHMWHAYYLEGDLEIYGDMLVKCFDLKMEYESEAYICDICVQRLREAVQFKQQVIDASEQLKKYEEADEKHKIEKPEVCVYELEIDMENQEVQQELIVPATEHDTIVDDGQAIDCSQYLEVDNLDTENQNKDDSEDDQPQMVNSTKSKKRIRKTPYMNYSRQVLEKSIEVVRSGKMSQLQASAFYGVPRKTISANLRRQLEKSENLSQLDESDEFKAYSKENHYELVEELKKVLLHTNATPFKIGISKLYCAYCYADGPNFGNNVEGLREHARTVHSSYRMNEVEMFMRPPWRNTIVKLDVHNFSCKICRCHIKWQDLTKHMIIHDIELDDDILSKQFVPFILKKDIHKCVICSVECSNLRLMDHHMDSHFSNFICVECGETFLTDSRLKVHSRVHVTALCRCDACGEVFKQESHKRKHALLVHNKDDQTKCIYCSREFATVEGTRKHMTEAHRVSDNVFSCGTCKMKFCWKLSYEMHMKRMHTENKEFMCSDCSEVFYTAASLRKHHKSQHRPKSNTCRFCKKTYSSYSYLKHHYMQKHKRELTEILEKRESLVNSNKSS